MAVKGKKIAATTLVETLVSMTIISLVAGMAIVIFLQVSSPRSSVADLLLAQQKCSEVFSAYGREVDIKNMPGDITPHLELIANETHLSKNMLRLDLEVVDQNNDIIYERSRIYYVR